MRTEPQRGGVKATGGCGQYQYVAAVAVHTWAVFSPAAEFTPPARTLLNLSLLIFILSKVSSSCFLSIYKTQLLISKHILT